MRNEMEPKAASAGQAQLWTREAIKAVWAGEGSHHCPEAGGQNLGRALEACPAWLRIARIAGRHIGLDCWAQCRITGFQLEGRPPKRQQVKIFGHLEEDAQMDESGLKLLGTYFFCSGRKEAGNLKERRCAEASANEDPRGTTASPLDCAGFEAASGQCPTQN